MATLQTAKAAGTYVEPNVDTTPLAAELAALVFASGIEQVLPLGL
jgi:hypothetical protein